MAERDNLLQSQAEAHKKRNTEGNHEQIWYQHRH
jgi:hypothetical protein